MRFPWFVAGFFLGVLCQDDGAAKVAHDAGRWLRCVMIECN